MQIQAGLLRTVCLEGSHARLPVAHHRTRLGPVACPDVTDGGRSSFGVTPPADGWLDHFRQTYRPTEATHSLAGIIRGANPAALSRGPAACLVVFRNPI